MSHSDCHTLSGRIACVNCQQNLLYARSYPTSDRDGNFVGYLCDVCAFPKSHGPRSATEVLKHDRAAKAWRQMQKLGHCRSGYEGGEL